MHRRLFEEASHATVYAKFRPHPPASLISFIIDYLSKKVPKTSFKHAVDAGCGTGQSTVLLAPYFDHVTGADISQAQIDEAARTRPIKNVSYRVGALEELQLPSESVALITACQAFQYFDKEAFFKEARRILVPGGCVALYGYQLPKPSLREEKSAELGDLVEKVYRDSRLEKYWPPERQEVENAYKDVIIPLDDFERHSFVDEETRTVADYTGYLTTWSSYQKMKNEMPTEAEELMSNFQRRFMDTLGKGTSTPDQATVQIATEFFLLIARKGDA